MKKICCTSHLDLYVAYVANSTADSDNKNMSSSVSAVSPVLLISSTRHDMYIVYHIRYEEQVLQCIGMVRVQLLIAYS